MQLTMHAVSVEVFTPPLQSLAAILDKGLAYAQAKKFEPAVLLQARLAPDMLPFVRQVQLASDFAKNSVARLAGREAPKFPDEERSIEELRERIARTLDYLASVPASALQGAESRQITVPLRDRIVQLEGLPFLQRWALPNFFFHVTTAYDILRHNGLEIGKRDFLGGV